ncbi:MAG: cob(I)yrinic acid a,c-diamide adenosyltransferase [Pseudomonadales bacterium]|nr:cob(I)yrinic acid a,c-diamide adenosyltransferase [Pseudomonadales bacterium]
MTKSGDRGFTSLADGTRYQKHDKPVQLVGELDEANCHLGMLAEALKAAGNPELVVVQRLQSRLFDVGGAVAIGKARVSFDSEVASLEARVERLKEDLEPLVEFVLPGGGDAAARAHLARAVVRRVERSYWASEVRQLDAAGAGKFLNRLSDYLFALARSLSDSESCWKPLTS